MLAAASEPSEFPRPSAIPAPVPGDDSGGQRRIVESLAQRLRATLIETHISFVLLTGTRAFKIKKAVDLGFLDYRTRDARRFYCEEELRLNRRTAPDLYVRVVAITGTADSAALDGEGAVLDYAVEMREFPQDALASSALRRDSLTPDFIDILAVRIAALHRDAAVAGAQSPWGTPPAVLHLALQNLSQLRSLLHSRAERDDLDAIEAWTRAQHAAGAPAIDERRRRGFVRECHGDLHLGNIAVVDGKPVVFDGIEFNDALRWIDVMDEVAFTTMDLRARGRADLASRFLNAYLEITGDYEGLGVLRLYVVHRAMVRAKVARLRATQLATGAACEASCVDYANHVRLAHSFTQALHPAIVITHGLSGSGKTTASRRLIESADAIRIRSDVERKRLYDRPPPGVAGIDAGLYAPAATRETYLRTLALAHRAVAAGFVTVIDATFLKRWQRRCFKTLAAELDVPFVILSLVADEATLRARIVARLRSANDASDADLAVLDAQRGTQEPLSAEERANAVICSSDALCGPARSPEWDDLLNRIAGSRAEPLRRSP